MSSEYIEISEIEKQVILTLAERGPMSGYDFHLGGQRERHGRKAIMSSGYWIRVLEHLGPKGLNLIAQVRASQEYSSDERGRRKDLYWLTLQGIKVGLVEGASPKLLLTYAKEYIPQNDDTEYVFCFLDLSQVDVMRKLFRKIFRREISEGDKMISGLTYLADFSIIKEADLTPRSPETRKIVAILKKYPHAYQILRDGFKESKKRTKEFEELLGHE